MGNTPRGFPRHRRQPAFHPWMPDTLIVPRGEDELNTGAECRPDPGSCAKARPGAREAAAHMTELAERFAEPRNAIMRLPANPSRGDRAGLRRRLLHPQNTLMSARGGPDAAVIAIMDAADAGL